MFSRKTSVLFFPINGSGLGHLNRCFAYARHLPKDWNISFFSLCTVIEPLIRAGYGVDYFVSHFWSASNATAWNRELAVRLGLYLERRKPDIVVYDGLIPYAGFQKACRLYGKRLKKVWSFRGLLKGEIEEQTGLAEDFDLIIQPGEINGERDNVPNKIVTNPVTLYDADELHAKKVARQMLGLPEDKPLVLFTLGSGNLKKIATLAGWLIREISELGFLPVWLQSPISEKPLVLPEGVIPLVKYPIAPFLKAFDGIVGAAGYNTCHEALLAAVPTLFVPNDNLADNQKERAKFLEALGLAVVCPDERPESIRSAVANFAQLIAHNRFQPRYFENGALQAARAIMNLA